MKVKDRALFSCCQVMQFERRDAVGVIPVISRALYHIAACNNWSGLHCWPILRTFVPASLLTLAEHDNTHTLLLPYHLPEVVNRILHRTLCYNVASADFCDQHETGINVVVIGVQQFDTILCVREDVPEPIPLLTIDIVV